MDETAVATTKGVAQVFDLNALKAFATDKRVRKMLFKTDQLWSEIACYEPGQSTVMHSHPREEEAIYVLEGTANMRRRCLSVISPIAPGVSSITSSGATSLGSTSMSAAKGCRLSGGDAGVDGGAPAPGGSAPGAVRASNVLVRRSRNFRQVGARSPLGRSSRAASFLVPFFDGSTRAPSLFGRDSKGGCETRAAGA